MIPEITSRPDRLTGDLDAADSNAEIIDYGSAIALLGFLAGTVVDRSDRRRLLVVIPR
jgi:hypothetical protein